MKENKKYKNINVRELSKDEHNTFRKICFDYDMPMTVVLRAFVGNIPAVKKVIMDYKKSISK